MTIHGVDVASPYQQGWTPNSLGAGNDAFVFVKATQGNWYINPDRADQAAAGRSKGLQVGWYHWFDPDNSVDSQVDYFTTHAPIKAGDLLVCDWEEAGSTTADKDSWIRGVQQRMSGHRVGLYCNVNWWTTVDTSGFYGDFLWIAAYQSSKPALSTPFKFWQYTNKPIDQNHGYFDSLDALKAWAAGDRDPTTDDDSTTTPVQPTAGTIHTPYGARGPSWSYDKDANGNGMHTGDDWHTGSGQADIGNPIVAVADGTILYAADATNTGAGWGAAFGKHVLNQWDEHGRTSIDAHMSKITVKAGDRVKAGDKLGEVGQTGNVSGPHDHHEQHTGPTWSDGRVKPIYPGKKTPSTEGDELDMADHVTTVRTKEQGVEKVDTDEWLWITDDNGTSFVTYPCRIIGGIIDVTISGLKPGDAYQLYPCAVDVKRNSGDYSIASSDAKHPIKFGAYPDGSWVRTRVPFDWVLGSKQKYDYRGLRFRIRSTSLTAKIEHVNISGWVTKTS